MILSALLLANVTACNYVPMKQTTLNNIDELTREDVTPQPKISNVSVLNELENPYDEATIKTIARGTNYHVYKYTNAFYVYYEIYSLDGRVVLSDRTTRPVSISEINNDLIEIKIGYGTGIIQNQYYNVSKDQLSEEYFYIIANHGTLIAYLDGDINSRKLIIQDAFQQSAFFKTFELDFSNEPMPVLDAKFSNDASSINITYWSSSTHEVKYRELKIIV